MQKVIADVRNGKTFSLFPRPHTHDEENTIHVFGTCVACGEALEASVVVGSFMLACRHQYHPLCFTYLLHSNAFCAKPGCDFEIPVEAKAWISGQSTLKSMFVSFCMNYFMCCLCI